MTEENRRATATIDVFRDDGDGDGWAVIVRAVWCRGFDTCAAQMGHRTMTETIQTLEALVGKMLDWRVGAHCLTAEWKTDEAHIIRFGKMLDRIGEDADER